MNESPRNCKTCGAPVIDAGGQLVHANGGATVQVCRNPSCGWKGSQAENVSRCPSCGDGTSLTVDHSAN